MANRSVRVALKTPIQKVGELPAGLLLASLGDLSPRLQALVVKGWRAQRSLIANAAAGGLSNG